jgi:two-component system, cell cycle sensor histidine kinase and response regulator CckA
MDEDEEGRGPPGATVLLIDDDALILRALQSLITRAGYRVVAARDSQAALEAAREHPIDGIVIDIVLPGTTGYAIADAVNVLHPAARVLYMSGFGEMPIERRGSRFLAKPFSAAELIHELEALLAHA